jgi:autotransporter passenger strand-loop-strand repeat protein
MTEAFTNIINVSSGVTSDTVLSSGTMMNVFDSGSTLSITVTSGGREAVYNGGVTNLSTIDYGGILTVSNGGIASGTVLNSGATQVVSAGGLVYNTTMSAGASQLLLATADAFDTNMTAGGTEYVTNGAYAINTVIGGQIPSAENAIIVSSGGTSDSAFVGAGGHEFVEPSGAATYNIVSGTGAYLYVTGGTATGTIIEQDAHDQLTNGGRESDTTVSNGIATVESSTMIGTSIFSGGEVVLYDGATLHATKIFSNVASSVVYDGGRTSNTAVENGGIFYVPDFVPASANVGVVVHSGGILVLEGGVGASTVQSARILSGGSEQVYDSAHAVDTDVYGSITVFSGGVAQDTVIRQGSYELLEQASSASNVTIVEGTLNVDTLYISGAVDFAYGSGEMIIGTPTIPKSFYISHFIGGDIVQLAAVTYSAGATVAVNTPGVVTITNGGQEYNLNIQGAYVGESDFTFTTGSILSREKAPQMQFLRPHVAPTDTGLNLTPSLDMFAARGGTMHQAAAPTMATSATASIGAVPYIVTSAPHPLVVPPHGV